MTPSAMHVLTLTNSADAPFLTQQLDALERRDVSFTVLSVPGEASGDTTRSPLDYGRFFGQALREAVTRGDAYDLVHAHYGLTAPAAFAQRRLLTVRSRLPPIVRSRLPSLVRSSPLPVVLSLWGTDLYGPAGRLSRICANRSDAVVVMSEEMRRSLGCESVVIPDGVDLDLFAPISRSTAIDAVGWSADRYNVLFPYSPNRTVKDYPRARRVVDALDGRLDRPVTLRTVHGVDHDEVPLFMNAADALLLTSEHEGSPNAVKEALACNLPVVATDVGDVRARLAGVEPSTVARTDDGLVGGLAAVLERGERSNGREYVREVSLERTTERMLSVYESVTSSTADDRDERRAKVVGARRC